MKINELCNCKKRKDTPELRHYLGNADGMKGNEEWQLELAFQIGCVKVIKYCPFCGKKLPLS